MKNRFLDCCDTPESCIYQTLKCIYQELVIDAMINCYVYRNEGFAIAMAVLTSRMECF